MGHIINSWSRNLSCVQLFLYTENYLHDKIQAIFYYGKIIYMRRWYVLKLIALFLEKVK